MTIRMQESDAADCSLASVLAYLEAGDEVLIERNGKDISLILQARPAPPLGRPVEEIVDILKERERVTGPVMMTEDFAADVRKAHEFWNQPFDSSRWD